MRRLNLILTLAYPPAVHVILTSAQPGWALWLLLAMSSSQLISNLLLPAASRAMALIPAIVLLLCLYGLQRETLIALYLPPVLISGGMLWLFARTLLRGREPLITTLARRVFQEQDPQVLCYTRQVTQLWSLFLLAMLLECLLLALFAPLEIWSLFANLLNYLFIALLFLLEYGYRRLRFPRRSQPWRVIHQLRHADWGGLLRGPLL